LKVGQERLDSLKSKIHPRRKPEDAKFEVSRGFIIDPAAAAEAGQPGEANAGSLRDRDSGQPGRKSISSAD